MSKYRTEPGTTVGGCKRCSICSGSTLSHFFKKSWNNLSTIRHLWLLLVISSFSILHEVSLTGKASLATRLSQVSTAIDWGGMKSARADLCGLFFLGCYAHHTIYLAQGDLSLKTCVMYIIPEDLCDSLNYFLAYPCLHFDSRCGYLRFRFNTRYSLSISLLSKSTLHLEFITVLRWRLWMYHQWRWMEYHSCNGCLWLPGAFQ